MSSGQAAATLSWFDAFPRDTAAQAATAICKSWNFLLSRPQNFHRGMKEPKLTKAIKIHVEQVTAREAGLLGMWAAENVIGMMDLKTGAVTDERRTDITYGWNDNGGSIQLVFEFKKLSKYAKSRIAYTGASGMGRFVSGIYSHSQPVAAMVGMLIDPEQQVVPKLVKEIESPDCIAALKSVMTGGKVCQSPSSLFIEAQFDTDHTRPPALAPSHGTIRIAHFFLSF